MNNQQINDAQECEKMSEQGKDKDCLGCSCSVCIAQESTSSFEKESEPVVKDLNNIISELSSVSKRRLYFFALGLHKGQK